jgi:RNA-directed DNA polymerase
MSPEL